MNSCELRWYGKSGQYFNIIKLIDKNPDMADIGNMKMIKGQPHSPVLAKLINRRDDDCCDYSRGMCLD